MAQFFSNIFLGWPAIVLTLILAVVGLLRRDYRWLVVASILALPFSWFLSGFPIIRSPVFLLPLSPFTAAFALSRDHEMIAWICAMPLFLGVLLLFYVAISQ